MISVCVIGYGYWGPNLCRNFSNADGFKLDAICDISDKNVSLSKKNYPGIKIYKDYKKAIKENNFKLIVLATPTSTHYNLSKFILNSSINLLVEKPLCLSVRDHLNLNKIAKKKNVRIFVDYPFIFSGSIRYIKSIYHKKKYGKLLSIESFREQAPIRKDTNVLWDLAIHDVSIINFILDDSNLKITSLIKSNRGKKNYSKININLRSKKNVDIFIKNNWKSPTKIRLIKFIFQNAIIYCDENETLYKIKVYKSYKNKFNQYSLEIPQIDLTEPLTNLAKYIHKNINKKTLNNEDNKFNFSVTKLMVKIDRK